MTPAEPATEEWASMRDLVGELPGPLEPEDRGPIPLAHVTAVVVLHDGARWIRGCLNALLGQTRLPDVVVVVDAGSTDEGPGWVATALDAGAVDHVLTVSRTSGFGQSVAAGLAALPAADGSDPHWIWLVHDDCAPEPAALEELLRGAEGNPGVGVLGPKVVDWTDPRVLLEVGITVDRAGHRITGLEARELDQGQLDAARDTLAVGTAGALVRREVWDGVGGLDPALPLFRDDVDLCWRVASGGSRTQVVPSAVVRHARAASTGRRRLSAVEGPPRRADRRHALWVLLANAGNAGVLLRAPGLVLSCLLRALGDLLTRRPQHARDELGAVWHVLRSLPALVAAAGARDRGRQVPARQVRALLAPRGASLRNRLGQAGDILAAGADEPAAAGSGLESGPAEDDLDGGLAADDGARLARLVLRPSLLLPLALVALTIAAAHDLLGGGTLVGGRLLPAPEGASDLWHRWWSTWTSGPSGGSPTLAPPWTPVIAVLSTITLGKPSLAIDLVLLGSPAMAALSFWHASRHLVRSRWVRSWGAAMWAVSPVATGIVAGGRFDAAVTLVTLPWLLAAAGRLFLDAGPGAPRRPWWVGLILALTVSFSPPLWLGFVGLALLSVLFAGATGRVALHRGIGSLLVVAGVPVLLALPWLTEALRHPQVMLLGLGQVDGTGWLTVGQIPDPVMGVLLSPGGPGMPWAWLLLPLVLGALGAVLRSDLRSRRLGTALVAVALLGFAAAILIGRVSTTLADGTRAYPWPGPGIAIATAAVIGAAMVAGEGLRERLTQQRFGPRTLTAALLAALCGITPLVLAVSWLHRGNPAHALGAVARRDIALLPPDVQADAAAAGDPGQRVLVLERRGDGSLRFDLGRLSGPVMGDEDLRIPERSRALLGAVVRDLGAARGSDAAEVLTTFDVHTVVVDGHSRSPLTDALDSQPSLSRRDTPFDLSVWDVTVPAARAEVLPPAIAAAARANVAVSAGVGRGPGRSALAATPPLLLKAGASSVRGTIPAGVAGRLLVLADAQDSGWRATLDGKDLEAVRAWGWAQGWVLPPDAGTVVITRSESRHHTLDVIQLIVLGIVLILAAPTAGSDDETLAEALDDEGALA